MFRKTLAGTIFLGAVCALPASASDDNSDTLASFDGGLGVIPLATSTVRTVLPAGQIWAIDSLDARVRTNGRITVRGKGLILGAGNSAGRATGQSVIATLICQAAAPFTLSSTPAPGSLLSLTGDFKIDAVLSPLPPVPCDSPMLLIRNAANGGWFAVGILDPLTSSHGDRDD